MGSDKNRNTKKRSKRTKNISSTICGIDDCDLKITDRIIYNKNTKTIWISSFLRHKKYITFLTHHKGGMVNREILFNRNEKEKIIQNQIRNVMKKDYTISPKRIAELTGNSVYKVGRYYMKIRRENSK